MHQLYVKQMPNLLPDPELVSLSQMFGHNRTVEEFVIRFTHTLKEAIMSKSDRLGFAIGFIVCLLPAVPLNTNAQAGGADRGTASTVFREPIPNVPGKSLVAVVVSYAPGAKSPAHRHANSAFI